MYMIIVMTKIFGLAMGFCEIYANLHPGALARPVAHSENIDVWRANRGRIA